VEDRFRTSVLVAGGLVNIGRPEVNCMSYVKRVKTPTLILNGKYDVIFSPETSSRPLLDLLGTPVEHKRLILYETDHIPPRAEFIQHRSSHERKCYCSFPFILHTFSTVPDLLETQ